MFSGIDSIMVQKDKYYVFRENRKQLKMTTKE
jgi:hypothetical protein